MAQPHQLFGLSAQARYASWKQEQSASKGRKAAPSKRITAKFASDERKLKSLSKMFFMSPDEVLTERPEEFSPEFLKRRGVWSLVEDTYNERCA